MMRILTLFLLSAASLFAATSVTHNDITWTFDTDYTVGQYVNGDYYVVENSPGGGVTINSVSPAPSGGDNGSMVNPLNFKDNNSQGFDSGLAYYDAAAAITYPYTASAGDSIVSVDSHNQANSYTQTWFENRSVSGKFAALKSAEVLTVVASAPAANTFRPPFMGTDKSTFNVSDIVTARLPNLAATANLPSDLTLWERGLERPWLMMVSGWQGREMHPLENMPNYHEYIVELLNEAAILLFSENVTDALRNNFIQLGIDQYAMMQSGNGGGSTAFTRMPIIIAGHLLNDSDMLNLFYTGSPAQYGREDKLFYFASDKQSTTVSTIVPPGQTWTGATVFFRKQANNQEHEHLHPSEWGIVDGGGKRGENYRVDVDSRPHVGLVLAARVFGLLTEMNHPAYNEFFDRWFDEPYNATYKPIVESYWGSQSSDAQTGSRNWVKEMWTAYSDYAAGADVTAPVISSIQTSVTDTTATITWTTDEVADSTVNYGLTAGYGSSSSDADSVTSHSITITGLTAETEYHYQVVSDDPSGNSSSSSDATFTTAAAQNAVADPTATFGSGQYFDSLTEVFSTATASSDLYYTTDGTTPDSGDTLFSTNVSISSSSAYRVIGIRSGYTDSAVVDFSYDFGPWEQVGAVAWDNIIMDSKTGDFSQTLYVVANDVEIDLTIGHSEGDAAAWSDLATTARLLNGVIDARDGGSYTADSVVNFQAGTNVKLEFAITWSAKTYDLTVTVGDAAPVLIADDYGWRTGTTEAAELNRIGHFESFGDGATISKTAISGNPIDSVFRKGGQGRLKASVKTDSSGRIKITVN